MIEIHGPTYTYSGEILSSPEIILIRDHHYNPYEHCYHVEKLLENSSCDPQQHLLVFDHVNMQEGLPQYPYVCLPMLLARENREFIQQNIQPDWNSPGVQSHQCLFCHNGFSFIICRFGYQ